MIKIYLLYVLHLILYYSSYVIMSSLLGNVGPKYRNVFIFLTCNNIRFETSVFIPTFFKHVA